jgi:hypothetical protein
MPEVSDPAVTVDPRLKPPPSTCLSAGHLDDERQPRPTIRNGWARIWPSLLATVTLPAVGGSAAVASYRHARDVIAEHGDPVMAPWLVLTHRRHAAGRARRTHWDRSQP